MPASSYQSRIRAALDRYGKRRYHRPRKADREPDLSGWKQLELNLATESNIPAADFRSQGKTS